MGVNLFEQPGVRHRHGHDPGEIGGPRDVIGGDRHDVSVEGVEDPDGLVAQADGHREDAGDPRRPHPAGEGRTDPQVVLVIRREEGLAVLEDPARHALTRADDDLAEGLRPRSLAGGEPKRMTHFGSGQVSDFRWSRDGKRLLVVWGATSDDVVLLSGLQ